VDQFKGAEYFCKELYFYCQEDAGPSSTEETLPPTTLVEAFSSSSNFPSENGTEEVTCLSATVRLKGRKA
ncbi:hypothetical protein CHARACLAT_028046, partial [Characodon lateralis]|nr:hypothetical protein [Characodon lateralis]